MNLLRRVGDFAATAGRLHLEALLLRIEGYADDTAARQLDWYARGFAAGVEEGFELASIEQEASGE